MFMDHSASSNAFDYSSGRTFGIPDNKSYVQVSMLILFPSPRFAPLLLAVSSFGTHISCYYSRKRFRFYLFQEHTAGYAGTTTVFLQRPGRIWNKANKIPSSASASDLFSELGGKLKGAVEEVSRPFSQRLFLTSECLNSSNLIQ